MLCCAKGVPVVPFPILAWYGLDAENATVAEFQNMCQAGFSINFSDYHNRDLNCRILEAAENTEMRHLISDQRIESFRQGIDLSFAELDRVVADYKGYSSFYGYYLQDMPGTDDFQSLGALVKYLRNRDPQHPTFINLLPIYATPMEMNAPDYQTYVDEFLHTVKPSFLSFSHVPILQSGLRQDYYLNLEIIRAASLKNGIPFWAAVLSTTLDYYPQPAPSHLRMQVYSALAYGAKGLHYYRYSIPPVDNYNYTHTLMDIEGNPTKIYSFAMVINNEVKKISPVLTDLYSTGVYHSNPVPLGCSDLAADLNIIKIEGNSILAGFFKNKKKEKYVLLVNRNYNYGVKPRIYFSAETKKIIEVPKDNTNPLIIEWLDDEMEKSYPILFKAGDGRLFRLID